MFLIDDRTLLWLLDPQIAELSATAQKILKTADELFVSMASLWKITTKIAEKKLIVPFEPSEFTRICTARSITVLSITPAELDALKKLPQRSGDSFAPMVVATAITHDFTIISPNPALAQYQVPIVR